MVRSSEDWHKEFRKVAGKIEREYPPREKPEVWKGIYPGFQEYGKEVEKAVENQLENEGAKGIKAIQKLLDWGKIATGKITELPVGEKYKTALQADIVYGKAVSIAKELERQGIITSEKEANFLEQADKGLVELADIVEKRADYDLYWASLAIDVVRTGQRESMIRGKLEKELEKGRRSFVAKTAGVVAIPSLVFALFFLSSGVTGDVIALTPDKLNTTGIILLLLGLTAGWLWVKNQK